MVHRSATPSKSLGLSCSTSLVRTEKDLGGDLDFLHDDDDDLRLVADDGMWAS